MMKTILSICIVFFSVMLAGCSKEEDFSNEEQGGTKTPLELHLEKSEVGLHACQAENCEVVPKHTNAIQIYDGAGDYRIVPKNEYLLYRMPGGVGLSASKYKVTDVLKITVEGKMINIEYISPGVHIEEVGFTVYDKNGRSADFTVFETDGPKWV